MRSFVFVAAASLVSLFACGSSTGSEVELKPEVTDDVVAPAAAYTIAIKCFNPSTFASYGKTASASQIKCCADAACKPTTASRTDSSGTTCYFDICDCGEGKAGGTKQADQNDTAYVSSDCR